MDDDDQITDEVLQRCDALGKTIAIALRDAGLHPLHMICALACAFDTVVEGTEMHAPEEPGWRDRYVEDSINTLAMYVREREKARREGATQ